MDEYQALSHTTWDCKYHIVFIAVPGAAPASRRGVPQAGGAEGVEDRGRALDAGSRAHVDLDTAEVRGVASGGVHQGQERDPSRPCVRGKEAQLCRAALLG